MLLLLLDDWKLGASVFHCWCRCLCWWTCATPRLLDVDSQVRLLAAVHCLHLLDCPVTEELIDDLRQLMKVILWCDTVAVALQCSDNTEHPFQPDVTVSMHTRGK